MFSNVNDFIDHIENLNDQYNIDTDFFEDIVVHTRAYCNYFFGSVSRSEIMDLYNLSYEDARIYTFFALYMIAHKYINEEAYTNDQLNEILKCDLNMINKIEIYCLKKMKYTLNIKFYDIYSEFYLEHLEQE